MKQDTRREGLLSYRRTPIEIESPEQYGYKNLRYNLTESSVTDLGYQDLELDLGNIQLSYTDHKGDLTLRQCIADQAYEDVLITAGAASALFITVTSLLRPSDHVVVLHPNYVTNIETPRAIGCDLNYMRLLFENKFLIDLEMLENLINDNTRLVSITYPHNPTGVTITEKELRQIISLVESKECFLLVDETYREMNFGRPPPVAALLSSQAISVSSLSKSYGLPGIRIGWLMTQDHRLMETFLAAKEQIFICNSIIDEKIAAHVLTRKETFLPRIREHIKTNFETVKSWMNNNKYLEWVEPTGGCVCFPRVKSDIPVAMESFYRLLNEKYGTFVGPGHWFEMDEKYMRIGYGWPGNEELQGGLHCICKALEDTSES